MSNSTNNEAIGADVLHELNLKHLDAVEADMERVRAMSDLERANEELALAKSIKNDSPDHVAHIAELQAIADAAEIAELKTEVEVLKGVVGRRTRIIVEKDEEIAELKATAAEDLVELNKANQSVLQAEIDHDKLYTLSAKNLIDLSKAEREIAELKQANAAESLSNFEAQGELKNEIKVLKADAADRAVNASAEREVKAAYPVLAEIKAIAEIAEVCLTEGKITRREYDERFSQLEAHYDCRGIYAPVYYGTKVAAIEAQVTAWLKDVYFRGYGDARPPL